MSKRRVLFLNVLLTTVIFIERPILPMYLSEYGIPAQYASYLFAVLAFMIMMFAPLWGDIGDKRGRKPILVTAAIGIAIAQVVFGYADSYLWMILSRVIQGVFFSSVAVSFMAYFNDNTLSENRAKFISWNLAAIGLGTALGSLFGGLLSEVMILSNIYYLQAVLLIVSAVVIYIVYPKDSVHIDVKREYVFSVTKNIKRVKEMGLLPGMLLTMTFSIGVFITMNYLEFYLNAVSFTSFEVGAYVFMIGIIGVIGNATITHVLLDKYNEFGVLVTILVIGGLALLFTGFMPTFGLYSSMLIWALVHNKFKPTTTQIIQKNASAEQGVALGVRETLIHFGMMVGSIIGGLLLVNPVSIFFVSAVIMFVCALGFELLRRKNA